MLHEHDMTFLHTYTDTDTALREKVILPEFDFHCLAFP